jgi:hypothetical protein
MRFLLVMLAVVASLSPLVACDATKSEEKDASPLDGRKGLAPATLQNAARLQPASDRHEDSRSEGDRSEGNRLEADRARSTELVGADALRATGSRTSESLSQPAEAKGTLQARAHAEGPDGIAANRQHAPTSGDEGGVDEGNGEPMDDVDDEEVPVTDKSGVDLPAAVDDEPEGSGIKLQD